MIYLASLLCLLAGLLLRRRANLHAEDRARRQLRVHVARNYGRAPQQ